MWDVMQKEQAKRHIQEKEQYLKFLREAQRLEQEGAKVTYTFNGRGLSHIKISKLPPDES
jgi:hypothetical protein